ncbi:MAG: LLM class F420-dependent oxidoreductase [Candidatus Tectomicrobia bacterium]|uniref:LLM class F420-dependent oxidoreductase n=1 Tax=Tectimicrobiota bacterium TaxID=2528274 RepID=A0A932I077_UNCTE|nr:LLM class F420-dependent oxidoreductase [Candidatus Tectomicrobia bacterium]
MQYGLCIFPTDYAMMPADLARAAEERGFESLLFPEHTHIPSSRKTPWPGGAEIPKEYLHSLDPFVSMGAAAAVTRTLKVGTGICLVIQRDPIVTAKEVASVDFMSGGRVLFGVGGGWNREEMENHGTRFESRWAVMRERIEAMKEIWTKDAATYHGQHVNFEAIWSWPKPAKKPHPPVLVGGDGPRTLERVVRYGDEWMPIPRGKDVSFKEKMDRLNEMAAKAGRGKIPVSLFFAPPEAGALERHKKDGVHRCLFYLPSAGKDILLPKLDELAALARKVG